MDGKKRKVMFLIYSLCGGGAERVLVETVNRLPKDRYDVTLKAGNVFDKRYFEGVNSTTNEIGVVPGVPTLL